MSLINIGLGGTQTITQSGTDSVTFAGIGTLNITGTVQNPIAVTLSQVGGIGLLDTINLSEASVTVGGVAGVSALTDFNVGADSTLTVASTLSVAAGSTINFGSGNGRLVLGNGLNLSLMGLSAFGPGNTVDLATPASSVTFTSNSGNNNGGTLALKNGGSTVASLSLLNGNYTTQDFDVAPDGLGGTLLSLGVAANGTTTNPGSGSLRAGQTVTFTVGCAAPVTVSGGTPTLLLDDGGVATYDPAASTSTALAFTTTVAAGQNSPDLSVTGVALNGATIVDANNIPFLLSQAIGNPPGTLRIDTIAPTVAGVTTNPVASTLNVGGTVLFDVAMSESVTVSGGSPSLSLNDGGIATFVAGSSTATDLVFSYTAQSGQSTSDLAITGINLGGGTVGDAAGNAANFASLASPLPGVISVDTSSNPPGGGGGSGGGGATGGGGTNGGGGSSASQWGVWRFFDPHTGTHFFTASSIEDAALKTPGSPSYRPDLVPETNDFGSVDPNSNDPNKIQVFRLFDTTYGTHFLTTSAAEVEGLENPNSSTYRPDLVPETSSTFYEHGTQEAGDVAVFRFFDTVHGTHFYSGSAAEVASITTVGTPTYRPDLINEGVSFYAPGGSWT